MALVQPSTEGPLFSSWDALDKIFDQAFAPRIVSSPLPTLSHVSNPINPSRPSNPTPQSQSQSQPIPIPKPKLSTEDNPYAIFYPPGGGGLGRYPSSNDSPLFSSPEPEKQKSPTFEKTRATPAPRKGEPRLKKKRSR